MSFKVLVIPENPSNNGYILKPLVERLLEDCGKPRAKVTVLTNPRAQGYEHVKGLMPDILARYKHYDLLLFLPDGDGKNRDHEFSTLEANASHHEVRLICCAAVEEVETWLLAGHKRNLALPWGEVRAHTSVKEVVFEPFLAAHGNPDAAGAGRMELMSATLHNFQGLLDSCPELATLKARIIELLQ